MWDDARQLNMMSAALLAIALGLFTWAGIAWLVRQPMFEFREVTIATPLARASGPHLESVIREELKGTFFTMNLADARRALVAVPWVRNVALRRQWPQRLTIDVEEHTPFARWNDAALVNTRGEVFSADWNGDLPQFRGPDGRADVMTARFREWSSELAPVALTVQELRLSPRGGWEIRTSSANGALAIELPRDDIDSRLARFVTAYDATLAQLTRAGTRVIQVDLRYRNGFAAKVPELPMRSVKKTS